MAVSLINKLVTFICYLLRRRSAKEGLFVHERYDVSVSMSTQRF